MLLSTLAKHIAIDKHFSIDEKNVLNASFSKLLDSPTARQLARQFIKENAKAKIVLNKLPQAGKPDISDQKEIGLFHAKTMIKTDPTIVYINWEHGEMEFQTILTSLTHELFGHVLEKKRAKRFGITNKIYPYHFNEELNAQLIAWIVSAELQGTTNASAWDYINNPSGYSSLFLSCSPAYTLRLMDDEIGSPCSAYQKRLDGINKCIQEEKDNQRRSEQWLKVIEHLINVHKMNTASFDRDKKMLSTNIIVNQNDAIDLPELKTELLDIIKECPGDKRQAWTKNFIEKSKNTYFQELRQRVAERTKTLSALLLGKTNHADPLRKPEDPISKVVAVWAEHIKSTGCIWYPQ
jgi:hypothetical protein